MTPKNDNEFVIRPARLKDSGCLADLCTQLGYPSTRQEVALRLRAVLAHLDHAVYVAEADERPLGWVHVHISPGLEIDQMAEIGGLVVNDTARGRGIGKALMARAEAWALQHGCIQVWLRSNIIRKEAHRFYETIGYENIKTSFTFRKRL